MSKRLSCKLGIGIVGLVLFACGGGDAPPPPAAEEEQAALRLYVFDCGSIVMSDVSPFSVSNEETPVRELFVPCYLVEHPQGRLLWDAGLPPAVATAEPDADAGFTQHLERTLDDRLGDLDLTPADVDLVAFSHMHFDHVGHANLFAGSTLLIQRPELEAAFGDDVDPQLFDQRLYSELEAGEKRILEGDHDVFGDGRVLIKFAPGHTPGHQTLFLDLENTGPLLLSGDLYHFRKSRELRRVPTFNTDPEATLASMESIEAFLAERAATLWIEHDLELARSLHHAPEFYD